MSKIKRKYGSIPSVIEALYRNQVIWDFFVAVEIDGDIYINKKTVKEILNNCEKKRNELVKELLSWFK